MCTDMCIDMCMDMCIDMCMDMCMGMCQDGSINVCEDGMHRHVHRHEHGHVQTHVHRHEYRHAYRHVYRYVPDDRLARLGPHDHIRHPDQTPQPHPATSSHIGLGFGAMQTHHTHHTPSRHPSAVTCQPCPLLAALLLHTQPAAACHAGPRPIFF